MDRKLVEIETAFRELSRRTERDIETWGWCQTAIALFHEILRERDAAYALADLRAREAEESLARVKASLDTVLGMPAFRK